MQSGTCGNSWSPFMGSPPSSVHSCWSPWEWSQGLAAGVLLTWAQEVFSC